MSNLRGVSYLNEKERQWDFYRNTTVLSTGSKIRFIVISAI